MYFERKAYKKLTEWKAEYADKYAVCLKEPDELANRQLQSILHRMNISLIF